MARQRNGRLLAERALDCDEAPTARSRRNRPALCHGQPGRVTARLAHSRGIVDNNNGQFDAGERLRPDWERAQLTPGITMTWDTAPISGRRGGSGGAIDLSGSQIDAKRPFPAAIDAAGPGLADILRRVVCSGEDMREAETALGWPARG